METNISYSWNSLAYFWRAKRKQSVVFYPILRTLDKMTLNHWYSTNFIKAKLTVIQQYPVIEIFEWKFTKSQTTHFQFFQPICLISEYKNLKLGGEA